MTHQLYRHYDENGDLLYVGVSLNAVARLLGHRDSSHWFSKIKHVRIQTFKNRENALLAETKAIAKEKPKFNIRKKLTVAQLLRSEQSAEQDRWCSAHPEDNRMTTQEFCRRHGINENFYRRLKQNGIAPRETKDGLVTLITHEDAYQWRRDRERATMEAVKPRE